MTVLAQAPTWRCSCPPSRVLGFACTNTEPASVCHRQRHAALRAAVLLRAHLPIWVGCAQVSPTVRSRSRRPDAVAVRRSLGQRTVDERVASWSRQQPSPQRAVRTPWAVSRFSTGRRARGPRATESKSFGYGGLKPQPPTWRGVVREEPRTTVCGKARPALAAQTTTPSPPARTCSVGGRLVIYGAKRARAASNGIHRSFGYGVSKPQPPTWRGVGEEQRRPTVWGEARLALAAKKQKPRHVRQQRARALWAVGWFSTGRSARGPRATEFKPFGYDLSKPQPPTWRGVVEEEPRATVCGGARPALATQTTTPSPPARTCSVGRSAGSPRGEANAGRAPRNSKTRLRRFKAAANGLARCR